MDMDMDMGMDMDMDMGMDMDAHVYMYLDELLAEEAHVDAEAGGLEQERREEDNEHHMRIDVLPDARCMQTSVHENLHASGAGNQGSSTACWRPYLGMASSTLRRPGLVVASPGPSIAAPG